MDHSIQALITKSKHIKDLDSKYQNCHLVQLVQNFTMIPITIGFLNELNTAFSLEDGPVYPEFKRLSQSVVQLAEKISKKSPVVYFESFSDLDYVTMSSIVWNDGEVILGPLITSNASESVDKDVINKALKTIVVFKGDSKDEFEALGLSYYKNNDEFIKHKVPIF